MRALTTPASSTLFTISEPIEQERLAWLALALTPGLGPRRILRAVREAGSAEEIMRLPLTGLEALQFPAQAVQFIADGQALLAANEELEAMRKSGAAFLTFSDPDYPERLREIFDSPALLWVRGDVTLLAKSSIAIVGTRHPTPYGTGMAEVLARDLAARGMVILSGMARGVDTAAHVARWLQGQHRRRLGHRNRCDLPKRKQISRRKDPCRGGAIVSEFNGNLPRPAKLSQAQPDPERHEHWRAGRGSRRAQRHPGDRTLRAGAEPRRLSRCPEM